MNVDRNTKRLPSQVTFEFETPGVASTPQPSGNGGSASSPPAAEAADGVAAMDHKQLWDALQRGIRWPSPAESPPFWDRPARDAPLLLGAVPDLCAATEASSAVGSVCSTQDAYRFIDGLAVSHGYACWRRLQTLGDVLSTAHTGSNRMDVPRDPQPLHVVHLTAEMAPIAKASPSRRFSLTVPHPYPRSVLCAGCPLR